MCVLLYKQVKDKVPVLKILQSEAEAMPPVGDSARSRVIYILVLVLL